MSHLILKTLGTLHVAQDGVPIIRFATDKARALLVYLAVEAARPQRREMLAHLLWPDLPDRDARHNLSQTLWHLRQAFGERDSATPLLLTSRDTIQFNPRRSLSVDVTEFTALLMACDTCAPTTSAVCAVCLPRLQQAADLYQGDFLAHITLGNDSPFDEWALHWRERLHQQALRLFGTLADLAEQRGDDALARAFLMRQLELEPWREEAHRTLMRLLARMGERSAALAQYATCCRVLAAELGIEPAPETTRLYEQIRDASGALETPAPPLRLPTPATALIGRAAELADLSARLTDPACRLLTLVGPGGIGKTRLALQVATDLAGHPAFPDGVVWVPLAPVNVAEHVAAALASVLHLPHQAALSLDERLLTALHERTLMLVLDNLEHLLAAVPLLARIIQEAPGVTLLVTSRERLGLPGEWVYALAGLPTPASDSDTRTAPAALLFLDRAKQVEHTFALTTENVPAVRRICHLVEGMPLGIELAASWVRVLSCAEIAAELEHSLDLLSTKEHGRNPRHASLRVVFDHSWQLLTPTEQAVLARLSVFRGGATREAIAAVCSDVVTGPLLPLLAALVDKSLIRRTTDRSGATRYGLHELVRQYAAARLAEHPATQAAAAAQHAAFYGELARTADQGIATANQHLWFQRLMAEQGNLRETLTWYAAQSDPTPLAALCIALRRFWVVCTSWHEGLAWIEQIRNIDRLPEDMQIWLRCTRATLLLHKGDVPTARVEAQGVLTRAQQIGDASIQAAALLALANIENDAGQNQQAASYCEQSIALFRAANASYSMVIALNILACIRMDLGQHDEAWSLFQETAARARALGLSAELAEVLVNIGLVAALRGDTAQIGVCREALSLLTPIRDHYGVAFVFEALAAEAGLSGNYVRAGMLIGAATMLRDSLNITLSPMNAFYVREIIQLARGSLDEAAWESARRAGALLSRAEAIALALEDAAVPPMLPPYPADHTPASAAPDLPDRAPSSAMPAP